LLEIVCEMVPVYLPQTLYLYSSVEFWWLIVDVIYYISVIAYHNIGVVGSLPRQNYRRCLFDSQWLNCIALLSTLSDPIFLESMDGCLHQYKHTPAQCIQFCCGWSNTLWGWLWLSANPPHSQIFREQVSTLSLAYDPQNWWSLVHYPEFCYDSQTQQSRGSFVVECGLGLQQKYRIYRQSTSNYDYVFNILSQVSETCCSISNHSTELIVFLTKLTIKLIFSILHRFIQYNPLIG
jgi:hypothetical protein